MKLQKLSQRLAYEFNDNKLLTAALSHRSVRAGNNERLEFLGDAVLNFIIGEALYRRYPHATEGKLSRWRSMLVREESLAALAKEYALGECLALGPGELKAGGARRSSILADAMEAVIGAIFLDANYDVCRNVVLNWYADRLNEVSASDEDKDAKTALQEYLQAHKIKLPRYEIIKTVGEAHAQMFHVRCEIPQLKLVAEGQGGSRRKAEQAAAYMILEQIHHAN